MRKERNRYQRKGYGLIFSSIFAVSFFTLVPYLGRIVWPELRVWLADNDVSYFTFFLTVSLLQHNFITIVANLIYLPFYYFEFDCIERYKTNLEAEWPWLEDPEKWRDLFKKSIVMLFVNSNLIAPAVYYSLYHFGAFKEY